MHPGFSDVNGENILKIEFLHICAYENITIQKNILLDVSIYHYICIQKISFFVFFILLCKIIFILNTINKQYFMKYCLLICFISKNSLKIFIYKFDMAAGLFESPIWQVYFPIKLIGELFNAIWNIFYIYIRNLIS